MSVQQEGNTAVPGDGVINADLVINVTYDTSCLSDQQKQNIENILASNAARIAETVSGELLLSGPENPDLIVDDWSTEVRIKN